MPGEFEELRSCRNPTIDRAVREIAIFREPAFTVALANLDQNPRRILRPIGQHQFDSVPYVVNGALCARERLKEIADVNFERASR